MCGIAGFFERQHQDAAATLQRMTDSLRHRGPDADGHYIETNNNICIAMGHRRLSIIDISAQSNQPMTFEQLVIVYNGEVYNFHDIREELQNAGYQFQTQSDTETVLKAFHYWGIDSVNRFRGMFAFCIFDKKQKKAYLVRDRVGVKPLYFYHDAHSFIFSSELKSLRYHSKFKAEICPQGLNLYLQYGYIAAPYTIFQQTHKVRPAHYIEIDCTTNHFVEKPYWDLTTFYALPKFTFTQSEAINQLEGLLLDAFSLRMIADVPIGVFLSGGIDSSLVAALLQAKRATPIETFTMGFEQAEYNEASHAKAIAKYLGTHHHEQMCTWREAESVIFDLPKIYDEPFADISAIPTVLLAKYTKQKVSVALSGDGGDELFCGYTSYQRNENRFRRIAKLPFQQSVGQLLNYFPDATVSLFRMHFDLYNRFLKFKSILSLQDVEEKYLAIIRTFTVYDLNKLLVDPMQLTLTMIGENLDALEKMMLVDFKYYLPDDIMVKVDRATMFVSLEGREPLLDHYLLEFAARLPLKMKKNKAILKHILAKYIPNSYFERKKQGFGVPVNQWLRGDLRYLLDTFLHPTIIKEQHIFNPHYVKQLCKAFLHSKTEDTRIWTLLMFQMWYKEFFSN